MRALRAPWRYFLILSHHVACLVDVTLREFSRTKASCTGPDIIARVDVVAPLHAAVGIDIEMMRMARLTRVKGKYVYARVVRVAIVMGVESLSVDTTVRGERLLEGHANAKGEDEHEQGRAALHDGSLRVVWCSGQVLVAVWERLCDVGEQREGGEEEVVRREDVVEVEVREGGEDTCGVGPDVWQNGDVFIVTSVGE